MLTYKNPKARPCDVCQSLFVPDRMGQVVCRPACAMKKVRQEKVQERAKVRTRKEKAMTRGERIARAQAAVNALVRARDAALPCISCGRFHDGQWHAGHYRSRGAAPHLALDMRNIHKQCQPCNTHLHGNLIGYRAGLIARFSLEYVEMLESDNVPRRLRDEEIDAIWQDAKAKLKEMKK